MSSVLHFLMPIWFPWIAPNFEWSFPSLSFTCLQIAYRLCLSIVSRRLRRLIYICSCQLCFVSEKGLLRMQNFPFIFKILYPSFTSNLFSSRLVYTSLPFPVALRSSSGSLLFILYVSTSVFCDSLYAGVGFRSWSSARLLIPAADFNNWILGSEIWMQWR